LRKENNQGAASQASRAHHTTGVLLTKEWETRPAKARQRHHFNLDKGSSAAE